MTCTPIRLGNGFTAIACSRGERRAAPCSVPGCGRPHTRLCDHPLKGTKSGKTCSAKLCDQHAVAIDAHRDYCPAHARQLELGGAT